MLSFVFKSKRLWEMKETYTCSWVIQLRKIVQETTNNKGSFLEMELGNVLGWEEDISLYSLYLFHLFFFLPYTYFTL